MKKLLALLLVSIMMSSLCACNNNSTSTTEPVVEEEITAETVAGNYKTRMWFLDESIVLNGNNTYDFGNKKGTFEIDNKTLTLTSKDNEYDKEEFSVEKGYIYDTEDSWYFDADEEYGLVFSPDKNGFSDQSFEACVINGDVGGTDYSWVFLNLNEDGTFTIDLGIRETTSLDILETYEGTYISDDSTLTLTYDGKEYPMLINEKNQIIFLIYDKVE